MTRLEKLDFLTEEWGQTCVEAIIACEPIGMTFDEFLTHCTACGGNWGGMLLTGLHELRPQVWDAIPDHMGVYAWTCICNTLELCGIEMPKDE